MNRGPVAILTGAVDEIRNLACGLVSFRVEDNGGPLRNLDIRTVSSMNANGTVARKVDRAGILRHGPGSFRPNRIVGCAALTGSAHRDRSFVDDPRLIFRVERVFGFERLECNGIDAVEINVAVVHCLRAFARQNNRIEALVALARFDRIQHNRARIRKLSTLALEADDVHVANAGTRRD